MNIEQLAIEIKNIVNEKIDITRSISDEEILDLIEAEVFNYANRTYISAFQKSDLVSRVYSIYRGLDILQALIDDKTITEIMVNSAEEIFIERDGQVIKTNLKFENPKKLEDVIQKIVGEVNRECNESSPIVDARLRDGSRVNVVIPPIALKGSTLTIRKFPENPMTIDDLIKRGALNKETALFLETLVKAKYNIFISGGTGSGKTTFLNALSNFIPSDERIITIEDSAELQIKSVPNLVSLETRNANTEGKGEVSIRELIKTSLRMRPNRIVVGEVRGAEALDMLQAMNTGHDGSLSTGHANSTLDMLSRLETMVLSAAPLPLEAIRQQITSGIDIIVHLSRMRDKTRKVVEITELLELKNGEYLLNKLYEFVEAGEDDKGKIMGNLQATSNKLIKVGKLKQAGFQER